MTVQITSFLRNSLVLDAVASSVTGLLMIGGASLLAPLLGLPSALLFWAGIITIPFVALLVFAARRDFMSRQVIVNIVALNALWVAASFGVLASGLVDPTLLGYLFVIAQALAVALFARLQFVGLRRGASAA